MIQVSTSLFTDKTALPSYILTRSRRRTISIHVHDGRVDVRAPLRLAQRDVDAFVREKAPWILRKLEELRQYGEQAFKITAGSVIEVMGEKLTVHWQTASWDTVRIEGNELFICGQAVDERRAQHLFFKWLLEQARKKLLPLAEQRVADMELANRLNGFTLRYTRTLWGRCSAKGNILFNPLVMLAPVAVVDYLIVHEACHLRHMNHSQDFWALVAEHCPTWKSSRKWLKDHGHSLRVA